jgi:lysyl-tRNA synthetase class 2
LDPQNTQPPQPSPPQPASSEYENERRRKRQELRALGLNPYGRRVEDVTTISEARGSLPQAPPPGQTEGPVFTVAGRVILKRDMGKLSFLTVRDETGDLQVGLQRNRLDELAWAIRERLDLGDLIVATGALGTTKTGEPTIWATQLQMSSKSLLVPPEKHKGLEDVELRYRRRYVDLWANPEAMRLAQRRIQIVDRIRRFWRDKGFLEVETPMLQPLHGGAAARPFVTHMNALDMDLYLRIAPELYLKRLLVGGFRKVFEINRNFRNEGISPRHNPEFTMLEAYEAYGSWETMAALVED